MGNLLQHARACIAILVAIALVGEPSGLAHASLYFWTGAVNSNWDFSSNNWSDGVDPVMWQNGNTAVFNGSAPGAIGVSYSIVVAGIEVGFSGYSLTGGSINFGYSGALFQIDNDFTIGSTLSGGTLIKTGNGSLTLSSNFNSYSGGVTLSAGALVGTTDSLKGDITNNALVTFDQGFDGEYSGSMSGNGSLTKIGSGAVRLSGNNSYDGGTTVTAGTLIGTTSSLQGDMTNNGIVTFDQSVDGIYSGLITGGGGLTKIGSGAVTLSANNGYTGATAVNGGSLLVNGVLSSTTTTVSGGLLGGSGTVSGAVQLAAGGTIAPGAVPGGIGILTLGSLSGTGGTFAMDITGTSAGQFDRLVVVGNLDYSGNTLQLSMTGTYANGSSWDLFDFTTQSGTLAGISPIVADSAYNGLTRGLASSSTNVFDQRYGAGIWLSDWSTGNQRFIFNQATGVLTVVPEPSTFVMAGAGIAGFALLRWRRARGRARVADRTA